MVVRGMDVIGIAEPGSGKAGGALTNRSPEDRTFGRG